MVELLGTYTAENASHAREDAIRCIVSALADPSTFLLDPLLSLKPVRFLEGELIHDLLSIFVSENLQSYMNFYKNHKEFVTTQGLNHEQNMQKMRLLTFMQLAGANPEISFETIEKELQIEADEVESFIIEGRHTFQLFNHLMVEMVRTLAFENIRSIRRSCRTLCDKYVINNNF